MQYLGDAFNELNSRIVDLRYLAQLVELLWLLLLLDICVQFVVLIVAVANVFWVFVIVAAGALIMLVGTKDIIMMNVVG